MAVEQVGGNHYSKHNGEQHWDRVARLSLNYFEGSATAYIERCREKGHMREDLQKAISYCQKMIELLDAGVLRPNNEQDLDALPKGPVGIAEALDVLCPQPQNDLSPIAAAGSPSRGLYYTAKRGWHPTG